MQSFHVDNSKSKHEHLADWPIHFSAGSCDIPVLVAQQHSIEKKFGSYPCITAKSSAESLKIIHDITSKKQFSVYYSTVYEFENGITLTQVFIPEADEFTRVMEGQLSTPGKRGAELMQTVISAA